MTDQPTSQHLTVRILLQIDSICDRFEAALRSGQRPEIELFLQGLQGPSWRTALRELLSLEIDYRREAGASPSLQEYLRRFPTDREIVALVLADNDETAVAKSQGSLAETATFRANLPPQTDSAATRQAPSSRKSRSVSLDQVAHWLVESNLLTSAELEDFLASLPSDKCDGKRAIEELHRQGKLTSFQAQAVYQGKTRGLVVGSYIVLDRLGRGGMGYVYKARHRTMKRIVALKVLPSAATRNAEYIKRFHREVEAIARLRHENIVSAFDASEDRGIHFLVMECVEGQDLRSFVQEKGPLPPQFAVQCVLQAARGLAYAHRQGVIHRDIKPGNLMLDVNGTVLVLDLGLAKIERAAQFDADKGQEQLTDDGQVMGTPDFMSPEQAFDTREADARSDIYSLGCTLYFLIAGKPPFGGDTQLKKLLSHRNDPVPPLSSICRQVSPELDRIVQRMLAKDPAERQQSMDEVVAELEACRGSINTDKTVAAKATTVLDDTQRSADSDADSQWLDASLFIPSRLLTMKAKQRSLSAIRRRPWLSGAALAGAVLCLALGIRAAIGPSHDPIVVRQREMDRHDLTPPKPDDAGSPMKMPLPPPAAPSLADIWKHCPEARAVFAAARATFSDLQVATAPLLKPSTWAAAAKLDSWTLIKWWQALSAEPAEGQPTVSNKLAAEKPAEVAPLVKPEAVAPPVVEPVVAKPDTTQRHLPKGMKRTFADDFEVQELTLAHAKNPIGQPLIFTYLLTNIYGDVAIPGEAEKGRMRDVLAAREHWLEKLGDSRPIPALEDAKTKRDENNRYDVGDFPLLTPGKAGRTLVKRGEKFPCIGQVDTRGLPPGRYRFTVELQTMKSHIVRSKQELEFELIAPRQPQTN